MCEKHRSDVSKLGQLPTMAELDARRFRHKYIFDRLVVTYLDDDDDDDDDDDCTILVFSENECWNQVGIDADYAKKYDVMHVIQRFFDCHGVHQPSLVSIGLSKQQEILRKKP